MQQSEISLKHVLTLVFLSLIWGTSFILMKKGLVAYSPVQLACLRIIIAGIAFIPFFIYFVIQGGITDWWKYIVVGLTGTAVPAFLFALAQTEISSSIAGIMNSLTPIFTVLVGVFFYGLVVKRNEIWGVSLGLIGAIALVLLGRESGSTNNIWYAGFIVISSVLYALNLNLVKMYFDTENSMRLASVSFVLVSIPAILILGLTSPWEVLQSSQGLEALGYITILAIMSTMIALTIFYKLVQQTNPVFASSVSYLVPIVALIWGALDNEFIGMGHFVSLALIIIGVYLIRK